jgi:hypothetical protein
LISTAQFRIKAGVYLCFSGDDAIIMQHNNKITGDILGLGGADGVRPGGEFSSHTGAVEITATGKRGI